MQHQTAACGAFKGHCFRRFYFIPTYLTLPEGLFVLPASTRTQALHHHFTHDGTQPVNSPRGAVLSVAIIGDCHP